MATDKLTTEDFKVVQSDPNGRWVRLEELNEMIAKGIIQVDRLALDKFVMSWKLQH